MDNQIPSQEDGARSRISEPDQEAIAKTNQIRRKATIRRLLVSDKDLSFHGKIESYLTQVNMDALEKK